MLNNIVLSILSEGLTNGTATNYIESRQLLEKNGYSIEKRKVFDAEGNDCDYLHSYCYKLGTMQRKPSAKTISRPKKQNDETLLSEAMKAVEKLSDKYGVKIGLASQTFERIEKAIKAEKESEILAATLREAAEIERLEAKAAKLQALIAAKKAAM